MPLTPRALATTSGILMPGSIAFRIWLVVLAALMSFSAASASAATRKNIDKCAAAIVKSGASFVQAQAKILGKCEEAKLKGKTCRIARRDANLQRIEDKLRTTIVKACGGKDKRCDTPDADGTQPTLLEIGWNIDECSSFADGTCTDFITDCDDIPTCIRCIGGGSAERAFALYYPTRAPSVDNKTLNKCQATIGKAGVRLLTAKSKALAKCWGVRAKGKTADCPNAATQGALSKAEAKFAASLARSCAGLDNSTIGLPGTCPAFTSDGLQACGGTLETVVDVSTCVACATAAHADCTDRISALSVGATYPAGCASLQASVDGLVGGTDRPVLAPEEGVFEAGEAPTPTVQVQPQIANLAVEATAVEASTRRVSVQVPATLAADGSSRIPLTSSLLVKVAGRPGFYRLPLSANKALVGIRFPKFGKLTKIPLRLAVRSSAGVGARGGDAVSEYVSLDLDAIGAERDVEFIQFLPIAFLVDGFTISDDDRHLYVGSGDELAVLARDLATGSVSIVERVPSLGVADVAVSPDGATVYAVSNRGQSALEVFSRDIMTGKLTFLESFVDNVGGVEGINGAVGVLVSPDGRTVYVSGHQSSAVAIFQRNLSTGRLTYTSFVSLGAITGQGGAFRAAVTADGRFLYVPNFNNALIAFARNVDTGALTPIQTIFGDANGVTGIEGGFNVELTSDEATLYVAGFTRGTVAVFSRNPDSGLLTFRQSAQEIYRTFSVAPGLQGDRAYATTGESLAIFTRDELGRLSLRGEIRNGDGEVTGLFGSRDILLSHDGRHIYVGDFGGDGGITVFRVSP